jgi:hypothetical protein
MFLAHLTAKLNSCSLNPLSSPYLHHCARAKEKNPDKYPQVLFAGGMRLVGGQTIKGFEIAEATEEQMMNDVFYWLEIVSEEWIPIFDSSKGGPILMAKYGYSQ